MSINLRVPKLTDLKPRLTVVGVGGAGGNAINNMIAAGLTGVQFVAANTDAQALAASSADRRIQLGLNLTEGLGAGSKPEIGEAAAEEAINDIRNHLEGSHMVFIAAGMGGGTGTGATSVIARVAHELGILTVGIVTKPFHFEGARRMRLAEQGIVELRKYVDTLIVIPNQNLFRIANERTTFSEAFVLADQVLFSGIACIVDLIVKEGLINLDFADVRTIMSGMGTAMMGTGEATGEGRAVAAAEDAISNPLLDDVSLKGAKGLLLSIIGGRDLTLYEVDEAASRIRQEVDPEANIIVGASFDDSMEDRLRVAIVASGMTRATEATGPRGEPVQQARPQPPPLTTRLPLTVAPGGLNPLRQADDNAGSRPPLPPLGRHHQHGHDSMEQRLSQVVGRPVTWPPASAQPQTGPSSADTPAGRTQWMAPGNVLIEEEDPARAGPSGAAQHGQPQLRMPPPGLPAADALDGNAGFRPAPPVEIRRPLPKMPEVDDFPPHAQHEYRSRSGGTAAPTGASRPALPAPQPPPESPKRGGLLQRLVSAGRLRR